MSKFNFVKPPEATVPKEPVDGSFLCHTCNEYVDEAFYLPEIHVLTWKCSEGHISTIKDFDL